MTFDRLFVLVLEAAVAIVVATLVFAVVLGCLRGIADVWRGDR